MGFPIRTSRYHCFIASFSALFAGLHVLPRLSSPRHPPDALIYLTLSFEVPVDFVCLALTTRTNFRYPTLTKLTACCVSFLPFVFRNNRYNHHPNYCVGRCLFRLPDTVCNPFRPVQHHCLCLLISASNLLKSDAITFANKNRLL